MKHSSTIVIISLVLSIFLAAVLVFPQHQKLQRERTVLQERTEELQNHRNYQSRLQSVKARLDQNQELMANIISALPDELDAPSFLKFLQKASEASGVSIERVNWSRAASPAEGERTKEHILSMNFTCSYYAFKNFLYSLERSARLIDIMRMNFRASEEGDKPIQFSMELRIHSY